MIVQFLSNLWQSFLKLFVVRQTDADKFLLVIEQLVKTQQAQAKFLQDWMDALRAQSSYPQNKSDRETIIAALTHEAQLGNQAAIEILSTEDSLNTYLRSINAQ